MIIIDTAGRSQRDLEQIAELKEYIDASPQIESMLTLSACASEKQLHEACDNFSTMRVDGLIFTKLDEAPLFGPMFNVMARTGLPTAYYTTGQNVPEDYEEATVKKLLNGIFATVKKRTRTNYSIGDMEWIRQGP